MRAAGCMEIKKRLPWRLPGNMTRHVKSNCQNHGFWLATWKIPSCLPEILFNQSEKHKGKCDSKQKEGCRFLFVMWPLNDSGIWVCCDMIKKFILTLQMVMLYSQKGERLRRYKLLMSKMLILAKHYVLVITINDQKSKDTYNWRCFGTKYICKA